MAGVKDFFSRQELSDRLTDRDRADGLNILITGANSGLGFALAVEFARRGGHVIMACRSGIPESGEKVKQLSGSERVEMRFVDLNRTGTIHQLVSSLSADRIPIDVCILNAAVALPGARRSPNGQDEMFQVNYLSNVILTGSLIQKEVIRPVPTLPRPRIIVISSDSHRGSSAIDYEEFGRFFPYGVSKGISNYSYFKLVLNTWATELSRRMNREGNLLDVNILCPGPVHSNIVKEAPRLLRHILKGIFRVVFRSPAVAALPVVYLALSNDYAGKTNQYLHMFNPKQMDPKVYDPEEGKKLWERTMELIGNTDPEFTAGWTETSLT